MNNDEQITHIMNRFDKLEHQNKVILDNLFIRLKVREVIQEAKHGSDVLQIISIQETADGVVIRVR
jgi:uncharacterized protein (DUF1919 family)